MKTIFCWVYKQWLSKAVNERSDPLVRLLDMLFGSECKYCFAIRCLTFGIGLGMFNFIGLVLMVLSVLVTLGEKYLLCEVKK
jgi:hypothetical protein